MARANPPGSACRERQRTSRGVRPYLVLLALIATACSADAPGAWLGTIDTLPSGAIRVVNPEQGIWSDESQWELTDVARIGTRLDSGSAMFGNVGDIDVDGYGRVYILDRQAQDVRLFDPDGNYVRASGHSPRPSS